MTRLGDETGAINLSQGLPEFDTPVEILQAASTAVLLGDNQYTFPFGSQAFREAIAQKYARDNHIFVNADHEVTVTCGVSEAMMSSILALTEPGDEVIIFEPWYENYLPDCLLSGVTPRFVPLHEPDYTFDLDELRAAFNPRTRLILINTPHNPTGRVFTLPELQSIASLCQMHGVIAITDEIYEYIYYDHHQHISIASLDGMADRSVTISGLGKTYALTGWRVGWTVAPHHISSLIRKVHDYLTICAPAPFQAAGIAALSQPASFYENMRREYAHRRSILLNALNDAGLPFYAPEGAYYVMVDFSSIEWDPHKYEQANWSRDRAFAEFLAREIGVAVVPGSSFYFNPEMNKATGGGITRVRFNFAKREGTLIEAAARLHQIKSKN